MDAQLEYAITVLRAILASKKNAITLGELESINNDFLFKIY